MEQRTQDRAGRGIVNPATSTAREQKGMAQEIERKFLVKDRSWREGASGQQVRQGYLSVAKSATVRVRVVGDQAWLTVKGPTRGITRLEFEYEIAANEAADMLKHLCRESVICKTRYRIAHGGHTWEVDRFHGANDGLVIAEIELASEDEYFERPAWLGQEVSGDPRYYNCSLSRYPFGEWDAKPDS
jgi:adenylate cyclase